MQAMQKAPCPEPSLSAHWQGSTASKLSTAQSVVRELCELFSIDVPHATPEQDYMFERPITFHHGNGSPSRSAPSRKCWLAPAPLCL